MILFYNIIVKPSILRKIDDVLGYIPIRNFWKCEQPDVFQ